MPSELAERVLFLLTPNVGNTVARAVVMQACSDVTSDIESLDSSKLAPFAEMLEKALRERVGPAIAKKTREKVMEFGAKIPQPEKMTATMEDKKTVDEKKTALDPKLNEAIGNDINDFLGKNSLPAENDVMEYAKYLTMKYGVEEKAIEKSLIEKVRLHVKDSITRKKIMDEMRIFLDNFPQADRKDIDDFIKYLHLQKLTVNETEMRAQIENERLVRKFGRMKEETHEIDKFVDAVRVGRDRGMIGEAMKKQGLTYLIKEESGESDSLSEFADLIAPDEKDMVEALQNMGLEHLVKK